MVKLTKYSRIFALNIAVFSVVSLTSCGSQKNVLTSIHAKQIPVDASVEENQTYVNFIAPYKQHIDKDLNTVLTHAPEVMDKAIGKWATTIGNLFANAALEMGSPIFEKRTGKKIDFCMLNHGGIRAVIPQGPLTVRNAFELMPFENALVVCELKAEQIKELANYMITKKTPHPLAGIVITYEKNTNEIKKIEINGKPLDNNRTYFVATNDYLMNGGDYMTFFTKSVSTYDLNYLMRNMTIDFFKKHDPLPVINTQPIQFK